eukprot:TRINITY_DN6786_c0_g1_i1.p2 TRINITY_DN6786_c0_g1~~TRINITY_DN6786_c0_g1_i1.p2  ORF type:complete len:260 (+),score=111.83 TRINITY_DN6786_c0_g1_i1:54-833(+)
MRMLVLSAAVAVCCAVPEGHHAHLHYFDVRGLGQAARLMMSDIGLTFTEERYTKDTWASAKEAGLQSGLFPFGQMPVLEHYGNDGEYTRIAQSSAILQFLARSYGYYGETLQEQTAIDVMAGGIGDLRRRYGQFVYNKEAESDPKLLEAYKKDVETWTTHYENLLGKHPDQWVGGSKSITWADILLFDLIDTCVMRIDNNALATHPRLIHHYFEVRQRPGIHAYLSSEKNHKWANGPGASYDNPTHTPPHLKDLEAEEL